MRPLGRVFFSRLFTVSVVVAVALAMVPEHAVMGSTRCPGSEHEPTLTVSVDPLHPGAEVLQSHLGLFGRVFRFSYKGPSRTLHHAFKLMENGKVVYEEQSREVYQLCEGYEFSFSVSARDLGDGTYKLIKARHSKEGSDAYWSKVLPAAEVPVSRIAEFAPSESFTITDSVDGLLWAIVTHDGVNTPLPRAFEELGESPEEVLDNSQWAIVYQGQVAKH